MCLQLRELSWRWQVLCSNDLALLIPWEGWAYLGWDAGSQGRCSSGSCGIRFGDRGCSGELGNGRGFSRNTIVIACQLAARPFGTRRTPYVVTVVSVSVAIAVVSELVSVRTVSIVVSVSTKVC